MEDGETENENCQFISNSSLEYFKKQEDKQEGIHIYGMDAYEFMMMDMDAVMGKVHTVADEQEKSVLIRPDMIRKAIEVEAKRSSEEQRKQFEREFASMSLLDVFSSGQISRTRREVIRNVINLIKNCVYNQQNILKNSVFLKKFCFFL